MAPPAPAHSTLSLNRRVFLAGAAALTAAPAAAQTATSIAELMADGTPFDRARVVELARGLSKRAYAAPNGGLPDWLNGLNFEQYSSIRHRPERTVWQDAPRGFVIEPLHRGFIFQAPVQIALVEKGAVRRLVYSTAAYDFGKVQPPQQPPGDIGFSGFRLFRTSSEAPRREVAVFQGASFLRAVAKGQVFGAIARALSLKTADPRGEEFPFFRAFWIEEPRNDETITVHALLDSESVSGVFTYTLHAGDVTLIDTEATIFPRVALDNIGIAGMQASYLFGWTDRRGIDDFRPAVYEVGGLAMQTGTGEWIWRPVVNPKQLQISGFMDQNPKGFGFSIRDRDFTTFHDHDARYDLRPTLWVEPLADWGAGVVQLVEIPSDNEIHDNIIAVWRPKEALQAGGEYFYAYRQHWCWQPPERPALAQVVSTRVGRAGPQGRRRRFVIDFTQDKLADIKPEALSAALWASNNGAANARIIPGGQRPLRVVFELDPGNENLIELRLTLMNGTAPASETWLFRWTQ